jgi:hypothetical protein
MTAGQANLTVMHTGTLWPAGLRCRLGNRHIGASRGHWHARYRRGGTRFRSLLQLSALNCRAQCVSGLAAQRQAQRWGMPVWQPVA